MNYRRALRISTDTGLAVFMVAIAGVVLWTADEILEWNILPDWIDKYAQVLVIVLAILAGFSVVISVMCSFAVLAESAAEKAGITRPATSRRRRQLTAGAILLAFGIMFGLHKLDQYRAAKAQEAAEQKQSARYAKVQKDLQARMPAIVALFSPELAPQLVALGSEEGDEAIARLMRAIQLSTPSEPEISAIVPAENPFRFCIITPAPERQTRLDPLSPPDPALQFLKRQFLTGFPTPWENAAVEAMFRGEQLAAKREQHGVFIDHRKPSAVGPIFRDGKVVAVVMLKGRL